MALILDGKAAAAAAKIDLKTRIGALAVAPTLVVVQVAGDPAADRYVKAIGRICSDVGAGYALHQLATDVDQATVEALVRQLSADAGVQGIIIQMPLPAHLNSAGVIACLDPKKDIDGVHPANAGVLANGGSGLVPATPAGGMAILRHYGIEVRGKQAVVIGRSAVVGRPMAWLLLKADATVTIAHSRTANLADVVRGADIVVAAIGRPRMITADMIKPGAVVVDFGINVDAEGALCGDVDYASVVEVSGAITPVPGGTGPMTNVQLVENLLLADAHGGSQ
ncbi:MAG: bifunctional 5,10-methylenetetrahydrofolate dehydrogenase/5,10-methenyltetrahydrofolate cyclohydrolase [Chloroflexaceae bacterium]|nr:bifunctional 5,10-methylenetetrahydrofolate dehydrogenase/5,10-methenyltetrahydrofolate cyclohydrolase [Chloroflexaceae bacterium]MCE2853138.1 bifunctional 5,10-methylenetetrahydrofolate dehydrogenase/5,10-methenyltetrahydrofolate cyclohydrolase [Chloroflexaceae bacterium]